MGIRRASGYGAAWLAATATGIALSWFGLRDVISQTVLEPVEPLPPAERDATRTPAPDGTTSQESSADGPPPVSGASSPTAVPSGATTTAAARRDLRSVEVAGGHVLLEITGGAARLVSAVPEPGYRVRTWRKVGWLRVEFSDGAHRATVHASWYEHTPTIEVTERPARSD